MGATLSAQRDSRCEEDEEHLSGGYEVPEDCTEDKVNIRPIIAFICAVYKAGKVQKRSNYYKTRE